MIIELLTDMHVKLLIDFFLGFKEIPSTCTKTTSTPICTSTRRGRPRVSFSHASTKSKKRKIEPILAAASSPSEILFAAKHALEVKKGKAAVDLFTQCTEESPQRAVKLRKLIKKAQSTGVIPYTPEEALAYILSTNMSRDSYIETRIGAKMRNADIYPPYGKIIDTKKACYPASNEISITEEG